ncbi:MAG: hypothetical protein ACM33T_15780 [Solirubrobacterales bacterium]
MITPRALLFGAALLAALPAAAQAPQPFGLLMPALSPGDHLATSRAWLESNAADGPGWRFAARQMAAVERFAEAADAFARADRLDPSGADPIARAAVLARLGRMDEARAVAAQAASSPRDTIRIVTRALVQAGELGRARTVVDTALARAPSDPMLLAERAAIEATAGRPVHAIAPLERAVAAAPKDAALRRALVRAWLGAGLPVRAYLAFEDARGAAILVDEGLLQAGIEALQAAGDHRAALALATDGRRKPSAAILYAEAVSLAALGERAPAADRLRQALQHRPPDAQSVALLESLVPPGEAAAVLQGLRKRYPWVRAVWRGEAKPPPELAWGWLAQAADLPPADARSLLDHALVAIPERLAGQRAEVLVRAAELAPDPDTALARLKEAERLDVPLGDLSARRFAVLAAAGRWDAAAAAAWAWARFRPDDPPALDALFRPEIAGRLGWARVFAQLHDHVGRDPDDPARHLHAARLAADAGAEILALVHVEEAERLLPEEAPLRMEARTLARRVEAALAALGHIGSLDAAGGHLVLRRPDGSELSAEVDPVTGRLRRLDAGRNAITADWSADGLDLERLHGPHGAAITLKRRDGRLVAVDRTGRMPFRAEIGAAGLPTAITAPSGTDEAAMAAYAKTEALLAAWSRAGIVEAAGLRLE